MQEEEEELEQEEDEEAEEAEDAVDQEEDDEGLKTLKSPTLSSFSICLITGRLLVGNFDFRKRVVRDTVDQQRNALLFDWQTLACMTQVRAVRWSLYHEAGLVSGIWACKLGRKPQQKAA